ncbi:MAG: putative transport system permease protein [Acidobacteriaceae bacterium]|nr:putative transport system permease protein [Acidobacteriaceae bacterium]
MSELANHGRSFSRMMVIVRRIPRPVLIGIVALAFGLGVNTAIFTRGYFDFLAPYHDSDRLVVLRPEMLGSQEGVMSEDFIEWKEKSTVFQDLGAATEGGLSIITPEGSINTTASVVTPGFYQMMGDRFSLGYDFIPADALPGKAQVLILTHSMWKRLGTNVAVIGAMLSIDGRPYTVAGVLAPGPRDDGAPVSIPLVVTPEANPGDLRMNVIGRLKPGVSISEAQAELDTIVARIPHSLSNSNRTWSVSVEPLRGALLSGDRKLATWLFLGGIACFFLLESVSVVNLIQLSSDARYRPHR